ncbi:hypothetical protein BDR07DRAFT_1456827 [Suillus spraguei]|nr:hypothetical protein BDR07DRAFT_1456827 [Suillus spraguei]
MFNIEYIFGPYFFLSLIFSGLSYISTLSPFTPVVHVAAYGEAETITTHYLAALGLYRALYLPNRIYRYFKEGVVDPIAVTAGLVQPGLYLDFLYIYITKWVFYMIPTPNVYLPMMTFAKSSAKSSDFRYQWTYFGLPACCINQSFAYYEVRRP